MSKKPLIMSWNDRFALIDAYNPSNAAICAAFKLSNNELKTALALRKAGTFVANKKLDTAKFPNVFPNISDDQLASVAPTMPTDPRANERPETATKRVTVHVPKKRGRKGDKIQTALMAITDTPVPVEEFTKQYGISVAVLRQSKRFIENMPADIAAKIGRVQVKQDKSSKTLMIWRENNG